MKICFATRNPNKLKEIRHKLPKNIELLSLDDIGCEEELAETTDTIEGNSLEKAQYVWENYQVNCFADDSGLEVEALDGAPGVHSAYYSGKRDFDAHIELLLKNLQEKNNRNAQFKTVITLIMGGEVKQFTGIAKGAIISETRGQEGFGYDPIFLPEGFQKTFAEMSLDQKNQISHRSKATTQLIDYLNS